MSIGVGQVWLHFKKGLWGARVSEALCRGCQAAMALAGPLSHSMQNRTRRAHASGRGAQHGAAAWGGAAAGRRGGRGGDVAKIQ